MIIHPLLNIIEQKDDGYAATYGHLCFIVSETTELDGKRWLHASVSRQDRKMPMYDDLLTLKKLCIGEHRTALQVFPPSNKHINFAGQRGIEVLHLWSCLDSEVTPDFTRGTNLI